MAPILVAGLVATISLLCYALVRALLRNVAIAKATRLPYVITPLYILGVPWLLLQPMILPLLERLPKSWTDQWLPYLHFGTGWNQGYRPFEIVGADTFIAVSPAVNVIHTCDPEVSAQIFRRSEIGKPVELIKLLNVFGPGLTGSEGANGRLYRKITAPYFTEQSMEKVWATAFESAGGLMEGLVALQMSGSDLNLRSNAANMTLYNLFTVCFDKHPKKFELEETIPAGHRVGFRQTVLSVLDHMAIIALIPKCVQKYLPLNGYQAAYQSSSELESYLLDLEKDGSCANKSNTPPNTPSNLLDFLVQAQLPSRAIIGNTFSFIFAGHEANANTLTFAIFLLACYPSIQRSLQADVDRIKASHPMNSFSYRNSYPLLKERLVGAVINETLRLFTILPFLPKRTANNAQQISIQGKTYTLPANTLVLMNTSATHRHPAYWPSPTTDSLGGIPPHPVSSFNPKYWLHRPSEADGDKFLRPKPGSFIPFSDGARGCLGRQFALVELCAQIARIFEEWSVELIFEGMDDDDDDVIGIGEEEVEKRKGWQEARRRAEETMSKGVTFDMTLRPKEMVPVRFVKRKKVNPSNLPEGNF